MFRDGIGADFMIENETARDRELLRRAHCWEVIGDGTAQVRLLVARLREIEQIASDPAFESDAMNWAFQLARVPMPEEDEPCPV
jgi:hypothetical protein